ncbi:MAG: hypothetical protein GDA46_01180 [Bdellovibrionales bacterium]|nr:hypothetical protein [Bdellovibrionales bacterium]
MKFFKKNYIEKQICCFSLLFLFGCVSLNSKLENLSYKDSKSKVLVTLGQPYKITRKKGKDHWSYRVIIEGRHYTRDVIFKEGKVYRVSGYVPYPITKF